MSDRQTLVSRIRTIGFDSAHHLSVRQILSADHKHKARPIMYDARWHKARRMYLASNPLCAECMRRGRVTAAAVVDHIVPHKNNPALFWQEDNWQSLCTKHHNKKTASEDGGFGNKPGNKSLGACGIDGFPLNPNHPWNKERI